MSSGTNLPVLACARLVFQKGTNHYLLRLALLSLVFPAWTQAQVTSVWNGGAGAWETGASWSPNGVPGTNLHDVYIDNGNAAVSAVTMTSDQLIGRLSIDNGDSFILNGNTWLTIQGGGFAGSGAINLNGTMTMNPLSQLRLGTTSGQTFYLNGTGTFNLGTGSILSPVSGNTLVNNVTIAGSGGISGIDLVNNGAISATGINGINLQPLGTLTNNGTITANAGSKVTFNSGTYLNSGGVMTADGASSQLVMHNGAVVRGGTLRGINGGEVLLYGDNVLLDGETNGAITLEGQTRIQANYWPYIRGQINNNGTISTGAASQIRIASGQSATIGSTNYSGELVLSSAYILGSGGGSVFTNGSGHTIRGSGNIGNGTLNLVNQGTIGGGPGTINISPTTSFVNEYFGAVKADGGGIVNFTSGSISNSGSPGYYWHSGAFIADTSGSINLTGSATLTNYSAGTMTNGFYEVIGGGQLNLGIGNITTLVNAGVILDGAAANFTPIDTLANISGGYFGITNGRNFTTVGGLANQNYGQVVVGSGSTLTVNGVLNNSASLSVDQGGTMIATAAPLTQYNPATSTLTAGQWYVGGTFKFAGGDINKLAGELYLMGPSAQILKQDGTNAIGGLALVESTGTLGVYGGTTYTGPSSFVNNGRVRLGDNLLGGSLVLPGTYTQNSGITSLDSGSLIAGGNIFFEAGELAGNGLLQPGGTSPTVTVSGILNPWQDSYYGVSGALEIAGRLGLASGSVYQWSLANYLDNSNGVAGDDWDLITASKGVFGGNVDISFWHWSVQNPDNPGSFWQTNHEWDVMIADQGGMAAAFSLTNGTYANGSFSLTSVSSGNSTVLRLLYSASAVPEPAQGLLVASMGLLALTTRCRKV